MQHLTSRLPVFWALLLPVVLLGPALAPGYLLTYDMVWVPDLAMRSDFWGVGSALPRAVPSDAVVAVLDELVPGMVLQKVVLLGTLVLAGLGARTLAPRHSTVGQLVATSLYVWNPFVAERLQLGHWPVLLGYALLPWILALASRWRTTGELPAPLLVLVPLGSLSASAGLVTAVLLVAFAARRSWRRNLVVLALVVAGNAPWLVSGLLHASSATAASSGAELFALNGAGLLPAPFAALGLGGIWNSEVVLPSREGALAVVSLAFVLVLVTLGSRAWWRRLPRRQSVAFLVCWALGWGGAVLTWAAPGLVGWLAGHVPGAGVVRDGARLLALCAPLLIAVAAQGAAVLWGRLPALRVPRAAAAAILAVLPVTFLPDAALGLAGRLDPTDYPASYDLARTVVAEAQEGGEGDLLLLPLSSYRQPAWNDGRKVLDPLGRYVDANYVASDVLVVSGRPITGEDPRASAAADRLEARSPPERTRGLAELGIALVVLDRRAPGETPGIDGRVLLDTEELRIVALPAVVPREIPRGWVPAMILAWLAFAGALVTGAVKVAGARLRRVRGHTC